MKAGIIIFLSYLEKHSAATFYYQEGNDAKRDRDVSFNNTVQL
jgi:hypothetical protein